MSQIRALHLSYSFHTLLIALTPHLSGVQSTGQSHQCGIRHKGRPGIQFKVPSNTAGFVGFIINQERLDTGCCLSNAMSYKSLMPQETIINVFNDHYLNLSRGTKPFDILVPYTLLYIIYYNNHNLQVAARSQEARGAALTGELCYIPQGLGGEKGITYTGTPGLFYKESNFQIPYFQIPYFSILKASRSLIRRNPFLTFKVQESYVYVKNFSNQCK